MIEQFVNDAVTQLDGGIIDSVTTLDVVDASQFPASPQFRIRIGDELLLVTGVAGETWTVVRGIEGTTAASHSHEDEVTHVITAGALAKFRADNVIAGGTRPSAGTDGRIFIPDDAVVFQRDNGSTWDSFGPIAKFVQPDVSDFGWINQGDTVAANSGGGIFITRPGDEDGKSLLVRSVPSAPYTITAAFRAMLNIQAGERDFGLVLRDSGTEKLVTASFSFSQSFNTLVPNFRMQKSDSPTTGFTNYSDFPTRYFGSFHVFWVRVGDDNTNRITSISVDGVHWTVIHTVSRTDHITADQVGFYVGREGSSNTMFDDQVVLLSWDQ